MNNIETLQGNAGPSSPGRVGRSVGAVLAGLFTIFAVTTATDVVLHIASVFPPVNVRMSDALFLLATAYRVVYGIAGCYVAARLAPSRPARHAYVLGAIGVVLSTAGAVVMWNAGPAWYSLAVIAMSMPCAWVAARLVGSTENT